MYRPRFLTYIAATPTLEECKERLVEVISSFLLPTLISLRKLKLKIIRYNYSPFDNSTASSLFMLDRDQFDAKAMSKLDGILGSNLIFDVSLLS